MIKIFSNNHISFYFYILMIVNIVILIAGCEKSGELSSKISFDQNFISPTISNLNVVNSVLSRRKGGILRVSCNWISPKEVATSCIYIAFVRSIFDNLASYTGTIDIISSNVASITNMSNSQILNGGIFNATYSNEVASIPNNQLATDTQANPDAFYSRFAKVLEFPLHIGTNKLEGICTIELPFTNKDLFDAPLGSHILVMWLMINGRRTNSLVFELKIVE